MYTFWAKTKKKNIVILYVSLLSPLNYISIGKRAKYSITWLHTRACKYNVSAREGVKRTYLDLN